MRIAVVVQSIPLLAAFLALAPGVQAQPLGSFTWQLQPFCNRVTVNVRQDGAVYTLDGTDDQCGAAQRAPLVGLATPNPDGTIGFGLNIVALRRPGSVHARASRSPDSAAPGATAPATPARSPSGRTPAAVRGPRPASARGTSRECRRAPGSPAAGRPATCRSRSTRPWCRAA